MIGGRDGRGFRARTAEIVDEVVGPVVEGGAVEAEARAAEIVAAGEIGARGQLALAVIGAVVLHQRAQREGEVGAGDRGPPVVDRDLDAAGVVRGHGLLDVRILIGGAALEVLDLRVEVLDVLLELLDLGVGGRLRGALLRIAARIRMRRVGRGRERNCRGTREQRCRQSLHLKSLIVRNAARGPAPPAPVLKQ